MIQMSYDFDLSHYLRSEQRMRIKWGIKLSFIRKFYNSQEYTYDMAVKVLIYGYFPTRYIDDIITLCLTWNISTVKQCRTVRHCKNLSISIM